MSKAFQRLLVLIVIALAFSVSCNKNALEDIGNPTTDDALIEQIKIYMNEQEYSKAIALFSDLGTEARVERETVLLEASAYAGRCGYEFISFIEDIADIGSDSLFFWAMKNHTGTVAARITDCQSSEALLKTIGDASARNTEENILMAFLGLTKLGAILSLNFDTDADDAVDSTGSDEACAGAPLDDTEAREVGTGITLFLTSLAAAGIGAGGDQATSIDTVCATIEALNPAYNFCEKTDPAGFTADEVKGIRSMINEGDSIGIDTCTGGVPPNDIASCPCL